MEQRFGQDFSRVRVHTGIAATESARAVDALAYTVGPDIVFADGHYAPTTASGRRLLAHELVHTVQNAPRIARQEARPQPACITGKEEGAGQSVKPVSIEGRTYSYLIWGQWQADDNIATFRNRIFSKWITWRFKGIPGAERQAVMGFLQGSRFIPFDDTLLKPKCCYSLPLQDEVIAQARALSGEAARDAAAGKARADEGGTTADVKDAPKQSPGGVGARGAGEKDKTGAPGAGDPAGEKSVAAAGDPGVLAGNGPLATLYLNFLGRYAGIKADPKQAEKGLDTAQIQAITQGNDRARIVTDLFTQGWNEYRKAAGSDITTFGFMEETLLTQRDRGNFTALHNQLEFGKDPEGLGLYKRGTPLRYYDSNGQPVPTNVGGYRDPGYRAAAPPAHALQIPVTDRGLLQVLSGIKNVTLDDQILIYRSAKGYYDNGDLLWPAVRNGWDGWAAVNVELQRQLPAVVFFIGLQGVATVLKKMQDPKAKGAGLVLEAMLKGAGKAFHFLFLGELADLAYNCGLELGKIQREEGSTSLDALSQQHLERAAVQMRQLLTLLLAAGLTAAIVATARQTAVTLEPPKGGGGALVPAFEGARVPEGGVAAPAQPPLPKPPVIAIPAPPSSLESRGGARDAPKKTGPVKDAAKAGDEPAGKKEAANEKPADDASSARDAPAKAAANAAAKARLQSQIDDLRSLRLQIFGEIEEASRPAKARPTAAERAQLENQARNVLQEEAKLQKALADLETTQYGKARAYSYSDAAAREVLSRSHGLDEMSGKKPQEPSIDHVVSIERMSGFEDFDNLTPEDLYAELSEPDNLRLMEKSLNSSRGSKRWANWEFGRRFYGETVWNKMMLTENALEIRIRQRIKWRVQQRRR
jgi:hypothetical protein